MKDKVVQILQDFKNINLNFQQINKVFMKKVLKHFCMFIHRFHFLLFPSRCSSKLSKS